MIAITRYSRNRMRAWRFEYLRLPKTKDAYSALWTHWWFAQKIFANSLSQEDINPYSLDFSLMTTQQRKSVIWDLLCCPLLLLLDWPERRLTLKRIVRWRQRRGVHGRKFFASYLFSHYSTRNTKARAFTEAETDTLQALQSKLHYKMCIHETKRFADELSYSLSQAQ